MTNYRKKARRDLAAWFEREIRPGLVKMVEGLPDGGSVIIRVGDGMPVRLVKSLRRPASQVKRTT